MTLITGILWLVSIVFIAAVNFALGFSAGRDRFYDCPNPNCHWRRDRKRPA